MRFRSCGVTDGPCWTPIPPVEVPCPTSSSTPVRPAGCWGGTPAGRSVGSPAGSSPLRSSSPRPDTAADLPPGDRSGFWSCGNRYIALLLAGFPRGSSNMDRSFFFFNIFLTVPRSDLICPFTNPTNQSACFSGKIKIYFNIYFLLCPNKEPLPDKGKVLSDATWMISQSA